jgi:CelD/BcsL family acetyltransferase involved in cellulose biosynthesis
MAPAPLQFAPEVRSADDILAIVIAVGASSSTARRAAPLRAEILRGAELGAGELSLWRTWRAADPTLRSPFLSPGYTLAVAGVHPGARVAVLARGGQILAFLPYQHPNMASRLLGHAEPIGGPMTDAVGAIAAPKFEADGAELLRAAGLNAFLFTHLVPGQRRNGLRTERTDRGLAINLAAGREAYWSWLRRRRPHVAAEIERRARRAEEELGPLSFRFDHEDPLPALERLISMKSAQYRRTGSPDVLAAPWRSALLRRIASSDARDCAGVLSTLEAGGRLLAAHFGLLDGTVLHYWFPVYEVEFARLSPGRLLLARMIDAAADRGIVRIERGVGTAPAKTDFANEEIAFGRGLLLAKGLRGAAIRGALAAYWRGDALASWVRRRAGRSWRPPTGQGERPGSIPLGP